MTRERAVPHPQRYQACAAATRAYHERCPVLIRRLSSPDSRTQRRGAASPVATESRPREQAQKNLLLTRSFTTRSRVG